MNEIVQKAIELAHKSNQVVGRTEEPYITIKQLQKLLETK